MESLRALMVLWLFFFYWISSGWTQDSLFTIFTHEQISKVEKESEIDSISSNSDSIQTSKPFDSFQVSGEKFVEVNSSTGSSFNQGLILDIQGNVNDSTVLSGHLSDQQNDLPNGNRSATLREFDQVQLKIINPTWGLSLGDVPLGYSVGERGRWSQWIRGVDAFWKPKFGKTHSSFGVAPSEFQRVRFQTQSSQQGGYLLGERGELNGIQPGSLKLWLDGKLLQEGIDFQVDYFEATLDFLPQRLIQAQQWVEVEFQWLNPENSTQFKTLSQEVSYKDYSIGAWSFHKSLKDDSTQLSHTWSGVTESTPIVSNLWQRSEIEEVDQSGVKTHRGSFEVFDGKSLYTRDVGLGYSLRYFSKDSNFIDLNQSSDFGAKWMSWRISQSTQAWDEKQESFSIRLNLYQNWYQLLRHDRLFLSKNDSLIEGEKWNYQVKSDLGIFHQEINYQHLDLEGNLEFQEKNFEFNPWLELGNWKPEIIAQGIERESDSLFYEGVINPRLKHHVQFDESTSSHEIAYKNRRIRFDDKVDSLYTQSWSLIQEFNHAYDLKIQNQFHFQKEVEELYQKDQRETWLGNSSMQYWGEDSPIQGEYNYRLENTVGKYRVPLYQEVPEGTGNVAFDSITGAYIQNVDRGDYILQGWVNDTTQEYQLQKKVHFDSHLKTKLNNLLNIEKGFLAYSQVGWILQMTTIDTSNSIGFWPLHSTSKYNQLYEASQFQDVYYEFDNSKHQLVYWHSWYHQSSQGLNLLKESEVKDRLDLSFTLLKILKFTPEIVLVSHDIYGVGTWVKDQYRTAFDIEWPKRFHHQPFYQFANGAFEDEVESYSFSLDKIGMRWEYFISNQGMANLEISQITLNSDNLPFALTEGYEMGKSYEGQANIHIKLMDNFFCDLNYLIIQSPRDFYQRMSLQSRAVF